MKKSIAIIGGGPSALLLAAQLCEKSFDISIYERNVALGRKFLVAGKGGFNLTHSEEINQFASRYTPSIFTEKYIRFFSNAKLVEWLDSISIPTFIGSSKRIFPIKGITPIQVFNAFLNVLKQKHVQLHTQHFWQGWNVQEELVFKTQNGLVCINPDIVVFSLGGNSWSKTGSDGSWTSHFTTKGIDIIPFQSSNCAFHVNWPKALTDQIEGESVKNITVSCAGKLTKGEVVVTSFGLEGGAVYALSPQIRGLLNQNKKAEIFIDLKPLLSIEEIENRLSSNTKSPLTKRLEQDLKLSKSQITLLKNIVSKEDFIQTKSLSQLIKNLPIKITDLAPIDEAISTVGGIALNEVDKDLQLKKLPNHFAIGEMLNWDAPTGGYLLQACFSMGAYLAQHLNKQIPGKH